MEGNLTLRQLRSVLPSTKDVKIPSRDWIRENLHGDQVFCSRKYANGWLVVFTNGFFFYSDGKWGTVLRIDGFRELYYETDEFGGYGKLPEKDYIDRPFDYPLGACAMWQLKRNAEKRKSSYNETAVDTETMERNADDSTLDLIDLLIDQEDKAEENRRLHRAWEMLTEQQKTVIWLVKVKGLSQDEVARRLGVSRPRVTAVLHQTIEKLKKNF